jgi:predicted metal-dependent HD superfamily phosphohydrolase
MIPKYALAFRDIVLETIPHIGSEDLVFVESMLEPVMAIGGKKRVRAYHNTNHIEAMWRISREISCYTTLSWRLRLAFDLAIIFHDLIYIVPSGKGENERESAQMMRMICSKHFEPYIVEFAERMILSTIEHKVLTESRFSMPLEYSETELWAVKMFLDLDMCILGRSEDVYKEYCKQVRLEYHIYSDSDFRKGRLVFLLSMMNKNFWLTVQGQNMWGEQAQENIRNEILSLGG